MKKQSSRSRPKKPKSSKLYQIVGIVIAILAVMVLIYAAYAYISHFYHQLTTNPSIPPVGGLAPSKGESGYFMYQAGPFIISITIITWVIFSIIGGILLFFTKETSSKKSLINKAVGALMTLPFALQMLLHFTSPVYEKLFYSQMNIYIISILPVFGVALLSSLIGAILLIRK